MTEKPNIGKLEYGVSVGMSVLALYLVHGDHVLDLTFRVAISLMFLVHLWNCEYGKITLEDSNKLINHLNKQSGGWVDINLDKAFMCIEKRPAYCDRGSYLLKAWHKIDQVTDCYIYEADTFPRYYLNFDCLIMELNCFIAIRKLKVIDIVFRKQND